MSKIRSTLPPSIAAEQARLRQLPEEHTTVARDEATRALIQAKGAAGAKKSGAVEQTKTQGAAAAEDGIEAERVDDVKLQGSSAGGRSPVLKVLDNAQPAGVFFEEEYDREGHTEDQEDPELAAAVEEAICLLFGVRGIHHIGPGTNEAGEPVVVIAAGHGFDESSLGRIPPQVHRFKTLLALPYDILPLRRDRAADGD